MNCTWFDRSGVQTPLQPVVQVDALNWDAFGGSDTATLSVDQGGYDAWMMLNYLKYGVDVYDEQARWLWGGYVHAVTVTDDGVTVGASLDNLYNSVVVQYSTTTMSGTTPSTTQGTTTAGTDSNSIATYGQKSIILSLNNAPAAQGTAYRNTFLEFHKNPPMVTTNQGGAPKATIELKGWVHTLEWLYYSNAGTTTADTVTQIQNIIISQTQVAGVILDATSSGVSTNQYRDGAVSCMTEIKELLEVGTSTKTRLLLETNRQKRIRIYAEPTADEYVIRRNGLIYDLNNTVIPSHLVRPGKWVRMVGVLPATVGASWFTNSRRFMIERVGWTRGSEKASITPRGSPDLQTLFEVAE